MHRGFADGIAVAEKADRTFGIKVNSQFIPLAQIHVEYAAAGIGALFTETDYTATYFVTLRI